MEHRRIIISEKLITILSKIKNPLAKILLTAHYNKENIIENSYLDVDKQEGMISWLPANKEVDFHTKKELSEKEKWEKGRQTISIGRIMRAILQKKDINFTDKDIEFFVNEYKSFQTTTNFKIIKGKEISKYYHVDTYDLSFYNYEGPNPGRSLYGSCMRHDNCKNFFKFYEKIDDISMLCLFNDSNLLTGRALIWDNVIIEGVGKVTFMDRIYTMDVVLEELFKNYAIENKYWFKVRQGTNQETHVPFREISNGKNIIENPKMMFNIPMDINIDYERLRKPYIDTLRFFGHKIEGENLINVLINHHNNKERSPKDINWIERWDRLDGSYQGNNNYHRRRDIFNNIIPKKPIIKYENGLYWTDIETHDDIFNGRGYLTENYQTVLVLFDKDNKPLLYVSANYNKGYWSLGDKIKTISKRKISPEYHTYLVDIFSDVRFSISENDVFTFINNNKTDSQNFKISDIINVELNAKLFKEKPILFKNHIRNYNSTQIILIIDNDVEFCNKLTISDIAEFSKNSVYSAEIIQKLCSKFKEFTYLDNKIWLKCSIDYFKELIIDGFNPKTDKIKTLEEFILIEFNNKWNLDHFKPAKRSDLKEGSIVKLVEKSGYMSQSKGNTGVVITISNNYRITWDFVGINNSYQLEHLLVKTNIDVYTSIKKYYSTIKNLKEWVKTNDTTIHPIGTIVKLREDSQFYYQAPELIGTIVEIIPRIEGEDYYPYTIEWTETKKTNGFRSIDLLIKIK